MGSNSTPGSRATFTSTVTPRLYRDRSLRIFVAGMGNNQSMRARCQPGNDVAAIPVSGRPYTGAFDDNVGPGKRFSRLRIRYSSGNRALLRAHRQSNDQQR